MIQQGNPKTIKIRTARSYEEFWNIVEMEI